MVIHVNKNVLIQIPRWSTLFLTSVAIKDRCCMFNGFASTVISLEIVVTIVGGLFKTNRYDKA